jgi:hypothetical protein
MGGRGSTRADIRIALLAQVNPGGYTMGTMTGYVVPTEAETSVAASSSQSDEASPTMTTKTTKASSPAYSTSTYGNGTATSTFVYTTRPIVRSLRLISRRASA